MRRFPKSVFAQAAPANDWVALDTSKKWNQVIACARTLRASLAHAERAASFPSKRDASPPRTYAATAQVVNPPATQNAQITQAQPTSGRKSTASQITPVPPPAYTQPLATPPSIPPQGVVHPSGSVTAAHGDQQAHLQSQMNLLLTLAAEVKRLTAELAVKTAQHEQMLHAEKQARQTDVQRLTAEIADMKTQHEQTTAALQDDLTRRPTREALGAYTATIQDRDDEIAQLKNTISRMREDQNQEAARMRTACTAYPMREAERFSGVRHLTESLETERNNSQCVVGELQKYRQEAPTWKLEREKILHDNTTFRRDAGVQFSRFKLLHERITALETTVQSQETCVAAACADTAACDAELQRLHAQRTVAMRKKDNEEAALCGELIQACSQAADVGPFAGARI